MKRIFKKLTNWIKKGTQKTSVKEAAKLEEKTTVREAAKLEEKTTVREAEKLPELSNYPREGKKLPEFFE